MKKFLLLIAVAFMAVSVNAQSWGIGIKGGADYGLNIKKYNGGNNLEAVIDFHSHGFRLTGLYEWDQELGSGFHLYYGFGANLGLWERWVEEHHDGDAEFGLGISGVLGIEWHLPNNIPLTLAVDWTPSFELIPETGFWWKGIAGSIKYVF